MRGDLILRSNRTPATVGVLLVLLACAFTIAADAQAQKGCHTRSCSLRVLDRQCSQRHPRACVEYAILRSRLTGWRASWMRRVPMCESGWRVYARNPSGASGIYQFKPETFRAFGGRGSVFNAREQARVAAWAVRHGLTSHWECR